MKTGLFTIPTGLGMDVSNSTARAISLYGELCRIETLVTFKCTDDFAMLGPHDTLCFGEGHSVAILAHLAN